MAKRFRVALSFPGEKRPFVAEVAHILAQRLGRDQILYDKFHEAEFARPDLVFFLDRLYNEQSDLIVQIYSGGDTRDWAGLDPHQIFTTLKTRPAHEVLLMRFDRVEPPGSLGLQGFVDLDGRTPAETAALILQRLAANGTAAAEPAAAGVAPSGTPPKARARRTSARSARSKRSKSQNGSRAVPRIFLSYRRDDSGAIVGRIYDRLANDFGSENIFKDVDSIPFGIDFVERLDREVQKCNVLFVVIGPRWLDASSHDRRRLEDPNDFVRIEIASALRRTIPVVPLLVDGAHMPRADQLPDEIQTLARRNGTDIRHDPDFHGDMTRLLSRLAPNAET